MRMRRRFIGPSAAFTLIVTPTIACAESCSELGAQRSSINRQASDLAGNNPGSALVFGGCVAVGASNYESSHSNSDALSAFTVCAGFGCAITDSYSNCLSVGTQLFLDALRVTDIESRMRRQGCSL